MSSLSAERSFRGLMMATFSIMFLLSQVLPPL